MPFEISEKPVIAKRTLDSDKLIISIDNEKKRMDIEVILEDTYEGKGVVTRSRPRITIRDTNRHGEAQFTNALNEILPDDDHVIWTNPRQTFVNLVMTYFADVISK